MAEEETVYIYEDNVVYKQTGEGERTALTDEELAEFSGVSLHGIAGFNGKIFPTMQAAYDAISVKLAANGGLQEGSGMNLDDEAFNALYTDRLPEGGEHEGVSLTWTIFGTVDLGSTLPAYYLSGGREPAWYGSNAKTIRYITMVGYDENAQLNIEKSLKMPYQWWEGSDKFLGFTVENLTLTSTSNQIPLEPNYRDTFDLTLENCTIKGFFLYYFNGKGNVTIDQCAFDGTGTDKNYALQIMGHETEPLTVQITNNTISGYPRGINIDQETAVATISGNTIEANHPTRGAVQLSAGKSITVTGNTIKNETGSAFWFYQSSSSSYTCLETVITNNIIESPYLFQVGDPNAYTLSDEAINGITFTGNDISRVKDPYNSPMKDSEETSPFEHHILDADDTENIYVSGVTLDKTSLALYVGNTSTLTPTVLPDSAPDKSVTWSSSNDTVASVDSSGKVTAMAPGTATISVKTTDGGKTATCKVTVKEYSTVTPSKPSTSSRDDDDDDDGYPVSVPASSSIKHGSITVSPRSADKNDTVTITVKPDDGYELDDLTVTDKDGKTIKLTEGKNGKFTFTMPASRVEVEATFTAIKEETPAQRFTDIPNGYWAEEEINWAAENGYINGNTAATFNPEGTVTRQQLWMILARLSGYQPADFAEARAWAVDNSISDGTAPGSAVSRQQMVAILYRYAVGLGYDASGAADLTRFPDHASVASYAADAMSWSVANNIVGGTTQGTLNPTGTATRAQFAVILSRFAEKTAR